MNKNCKTILASPEDDKHNEIAFLHGACHVFALALNSHFNYEINVLTNQNNGLHVYCLFRENLAVDVVGIVPVSRMLQVLGWAGQSQRVLRDRLPEYTGLCFEPLFLEKMGERAENRIKKFLCYYMGDKGALDIPGASRIDPTPRNEIKGLFE